MALPEPLDTVSSLVPLLTLGITIALAWYINAVLKRQFRREEFIERQLRELYRPMDILLRASRDAFKRYSKAGKEEQKTIAQLWSNYFTEMKELILKKSHLFIEPDPPQEIGNLLMFIDAYLFDYKRYLEDKIDDPFPLRRGIRFPSKINDYFAQSCRDLLSGLRRGLSPGSIKRKPGLISRVLGFDRILDYLRSLF